MIGNQLVRFERCQVSFHFQAGVLSPEDLVTTTPAERPVTRSATHAAATNSQPEFTSLPDSKL